MRSACAPEGESISLRKTLARRAIDVVEEVEEEEGRGMRTEVWDGDKEDKGPSRDAAHAEIEEVGSIRTDKQNACMVSGVCPASSHPR